MIDGGVKEVPEIGRTFVENALIKAQRFISTKVFHHLSRKIKC
jgi:inosine/xanthosine triphosphate pyrophosphatase family protein